MTADQEFSLEVTESPVMCLSNFCICVFKCWQPIFPLPLTISAISPAASAPIRTPFDAHLFLPTHTPKPTPFALIAPSHHSESPDLTGVCAIHHTNVMLSKKILDKQSVKCRIQIVAVQHFLGSARNALKDCLTSLLTFLET
jgi:hypothetical protein